MFMNIKEVLSQKPYGVIYCLTCKINGKVYIGKTTEFLNRMGDYKRLDCKGQEKIYNALKKYGTDNFDYDILDMTINEDLLHFLEHFYIETIGSRKNEIGYNMKEAGSHGRHSEETRLKMSNSRMGIIYSKETLEKMSRSHIGIKLSEETKKRISAKSKKNGISKDTRAKMLATRKENNRISKLEKGLIEKELRQEQRELNGGKYKHTEEAKRKIGEASSKRIWTEESRKKVSDSSKGRLKGVKLSDERKNNMSIAQKERREREKRTQLTLAI